MEKRLQFVAAAMVVVALTMFALSTQASIVPRTFNYQGYLTKSDGTPVTAPTNMTFSLYSTTNGKSPLWSEQHNTVPVNNGIYSVVLGNTTPIDVSRDASYYLGTQVGTDLEMSPRQPLASVPFALRAGCNPGDMISCYTGDISTLNIFPYRSGTRTCSPQGTGFGQCMGEVTPNTPVSIGVNASTSIALIGTEVFIHANISIPGAGAVPDGTVVNFAIKSGTGGTLSAATAVTAGGVASVSLTSPTDTAAYVVTATAGGTSADTALITFVDSNKPGSINLAASPTTGVSNNHSPVTLTATVVPADPVNGVIANGTPVSFTILSGTGTLSSATATTTNGVASVTLNSTAAGTITVNAKVGTAPVVTSNTASVPFIAQPTLAIVKLRTTGTLPTGTLIGGINAIVSAAPSSGLTIAAGGVSATGAGVGSMLVANTSNVAAINIALIINGGIQGGEFATLTYHIANGTFPVAGNFSAALTGAGVIDTNGVIIPGISVSILSVTIQ